MANLQRIGDIGRTATSILAQILSENKAGVPCGVYSICSANRSVIEAAMLQSARDNSLLLLESTSNQVNQFGGYTGQNPNDFAAFVRSISDSMNFPKDQIVLGGDHLGPHVWRRESAESAMVKACDLVRECVLAGYTKIHLDASMHLGGDTGDRASPLSDEIVSARAADLCAAAEEAHKQLPVNSPAPLYVIGTEVPVPGGEEADSVEPEITQSENVARTLDSSRKAFLSRGLNSAWKRVIAVVVQPGVEFGHSSIFHYDHSKTLGLAKSVSQNLGPVYEAHSTDYQSQTALEEMVADHFAILKVGPWLTFAFREAVFALTSIEKEWLAENKSLNLSCLPEALEDAMLDDPKFWQGYYRGSSSELKFLRKYSYSDRCRYYWYHPKVSAAVARLLSNLAAHPAPTSLISQYLPIQAVAVREGRLSKNPTALIHSKIREVVEVYASACRWAMPRQNAARLGSQEVTDGRAS